MNLSSEPVKWTLSQPTCPMSQTIAHRRKMNDLTEKKNQHKRLVRTGDANEPELN